MIVYRTTARDVCPADVLALARFDSHDNIRRFLIHFGELEAALLDEGCSSCEEERLAEVSMAAGRLFVSASDDAAARLKRLLTTLVLPNRPVRVCVPEGYAYYGLFPETYAEAARQLFDAKHPWEAVCIGIRSIGTSLSAVVCASLERAGCKVHRWTVRPAGHPFERELRLTAQTESAWQKLAHSHFVIVDEGPGLSGSSFACVADEISRLGVPEERISFLPAWTPEGDEFKSARAQDRWRRHEKFVAEPPSPAACRDLSAGRWRTVLYADPSEYPPVQPQHEARKFLCTTGGRTILRKFAGLGLYGEAKLDVARRLSGAGFTSPVEGIEDGYLVADFVPGRPLRASDVNGELLETLAAYLAFRREAFPRDDATPLDELARMIEFNTGACVPAPAAGRPCLVDGRMLPHEWIATAKGYLKTDAVDHGDNHFYPGPTDIAWDVAGTIVEFDLDAAAREHLIQAYAGAANDRGIRERLPFYTAAYLAFRIGYAEMNRFPTVERYRRMLEMEQGVAV